MNPKISDELRLYLAEQIIDYIHDQVDGNTVSAKKLEVLANGVCSIFGAAYPEQIHFFKPQAPGLVRAVLETHQLNLLDKLQKMIESVVKKDTLISDLIDGIKYAKADSQSGKSYKHSWVSKIKKERLEKPQRQVEI